MKCNEEAIDIVLLWVDPNDQDWQQSRQQFVKSKKDKSGKRFQDWDALKFVFRGISEFMPWIRKIHFVTCDQIPVWLNTNNHRLNLVSHHSIFKDLGTLPTFNSNAIDMNLVNIEELSEKFIIFNDDTFVLRPVPISRFFKENKTVDFLRYSYSRKSWLYRLLRNNSNAGMLCNNMALLNSIYSKESINPKHLYNSNYSFIHNTTNRFYSFVCRNEIPWIDIYHHPQAHLKSCFKELWNNFGEQAEQTTESRFRSSHDITLYLARYINLMNGNFVPETFTDHLSLAVTCRSSLDILQNIITELSFLCLCDEIDFSEEDFKQLKNKLDFYLSAVLPNKCEFEV